MNQPLKESILMIWMGKRKKLLTIIEDKYLMMND